MMDIFKTMTISGIKKTSEWIYAVDLPDFDQRVIQASFHAPVLVDLWAAWCSPCLVIAPVLARLIDEYAGGILLAKVEVDEGENMKLAGRYRVKGFPTIILIDQGEERGRFSGAKPAGFIRDFIDHNVLSK